MKLLTVLLSGSMALAWCMQAAAADRTQRYAHPKAKATERLPSRSTTTDANGLCIRDTGKPLLDLNLNHRCDREEYWARIRDFGNGGGRK